MRFLISIPSIPLAATRRRLILLNQPQPIAHGSNDYPPEILLNYLQLPRVDDRVLPLAKQITASAR